LDGEYFLEPPLIVTCTIVRFYLHRLDYEHFIGLVTYLLPPSHENIYPGLVEFRPPETMSDKNPNGFTSKTEFEEYRKTTHVDLFKLNLPSSFYVPDWLITWMSDRSSRATFKVYEEPVQLPDGEDLCGRHYDNSTTPNELLYSSNIVLAYVREILKHRETVFEGTMEGKEEEVLRVLAKNEASALNIDPEGLIESVGLHSDSVIYTELLLRRLRGRQQGYQRQHT
jgi:hypothetical protein